MVVDYCDLCDKEKEVIIDLNRLRICKECNKEYPENDKEI
tara:strand:- start:1432 stop:1551 length:120 start_codon:yes stop_codon:yes gene_type:complete